MKTRIAVGCGLLFAMIALIAQTVAAPSEKVRKFDFTYQATLKDMPAAAKKVRVWIPIAASDSNQTVTLKNVAGPVRLTGTREKLYGNQMLYAELSRPASGTAEFTLEYRVARKEYSKGGFRSLLKYNSGPDPAPPSLARFLLPDRLVPVGGKLKALAEENTRGKEGPVEKARALYDYVFHTMRYDKSGTGWGRGDAVWACDARHGNCTDFHSVFISMARAEKIPARFEIGFPLPDGTHQGTIPGYHCWAEFYVDGPGWIPVDISEAWKNPARQDYYFGTLDTNRVQVTVGRDLTLSPPQDGPPVNYFVYPYVEVDGKPYDKVEKKFSFRDLVPRENAREGRSSPSAAR